MKKLDYKRLFLYIFIITLLTQIDEIGFIKIGIVSVTLIPIIVAPILVFENKWSSTLIVSFVWGLNAWIKPLWSANDEIGYWFQNPLISFAPRFLAGILGFIVIRFFIESTRMLDFTKSKELANIITAIMMVILVFVALRLSSGLNQNFEVLFVTSFALIGLFFAMYMHSVITNNLLSGWLFLNGLLAGITLALLHTTLVLLSLKLFVTGNDALLTEVIKYSIQTASLTEIALTAFSAMVAVPVMVNFNPKKSGI